MTPRPRAFFNPVVHEQAKMPAITLANGISKMTSGHGGASGRFARLEEVAVSYAFAVKVVGGGGI